MTSIRNKRTPPKRPASRRIDWKLSCGLYNRRGSGYIAWFKNIAELASRYRVIAHGLTSGLPLLLIAGPLAELPLLLAGLVPGTLLLSLLGTLAAAITLGARRSAMLMPLITSPLMIPTLIFGCATTVSPHPQAPLLMLAALLAAALPLAPLAAGLALKEAAE